MKKIVHVMNNNIYSGAENVVITIINNLKNNYDFTYITLDGPIVDVLKENDIKYYIIKKNSYKEINKMLNDIKPDIVHAHDFTASLVSSFFCDKYKVISHLHNNPSWIKKINFKTIFYYLASRKFAKILLVSNSIKEEFVLPKYIRKNSIVVGNPISTKNVLNRVTSKTEKKYDICFVGRLTEQKDPIRLIKIINEIKKANKNIKAVIVGNGPYEEDIKNEIKRLHLEKNIKMAGYQKNPFNYMNKSKVFCLPSKWEGYGLVAFEAITLGLPTFVSSVGGLPNIIDDKCGHLCISDEDFIDNILLCLNDKKIYNEMSKEAIKKSKKIENMDSYMNKISNLYKKI